jgi:uncharacterized damage-inducible protein DinB
MKTIFHVFLVLILCSLFAGKMSAQDMNGGSTSLVKLVADDLQGSGKKVMDLADAVPSEDYSWRPEDGVRSVSEVYVHIAMSTYFFLSYLGEKMPDGFDKDAEKNMTDKEDILNFLHKSFDDAQKFLEGYSGTDYDTMVELPFGKFTKGQLLMLTATHIHEHLGQSIAYARSNHITPPWSK